MGREVDPAFAKQYTRYLEAEAAARKAWDHSHREQRKLVKLSKLGRKSQVVAPISESRGVRITDEWRTAMRGKEDKVFAPAFARRLSVKEVALDGD